MSNQEEEESREGRKGKEGIEEGVRGEMDRGREGEGWRGKTSSEYK